jgi:hypothetical protein
MTDPATRTDLLSGRITRFLCSFDAAEIPAAVLECVKLRLRTAVLAEIELRDKTDNIESISSILNET